MAIPSCEKTGDSIRNWGITQREIRISDMEKGREQQWSRDLNLSRARARELHENIQKLVQESNLQGHLAWKIARTYCEQGRFEAGSHYARAAIGKRLPSPETTDRLNPFEKSLPYFRTALARHQAMPDLLYDAALCYANASRALGWEASRFRTAVFLFQRLYERSPKDTRAPYQLALLFGKVENSRLRNIPRAEELLLKVLRMDEYDIPARFALAHIRTVAGKWDLARAEYRNIGSKLRELKGRGRIRGTLEKDRRYKKARENENKLAICIEGRAGCELMRR